jgi:hypothetical protein
MVSPEALISLFPRIGRGPFLSDWQETSRTPAAINSVNSWFMVVYFILKGIANASLYRPLDCHFFVYKEEAALKYRLSRLRVVVF